jgi:hypothetical protein
VWRKLSEVSETEHGKGAWTGLPSMDVLPLAPVKIELERQNIWPT